MGGSQLKRLKARLKDAGFIGQTNRKRKGKKHSKRTPNDTRRADRADVIEEIREEFNPFDLKMTRGKRADAKSRNITVGKPGINKQIGEERRKADWEARKARKNKAGGIIDKRFGERNKAMSNEEKMLERFTREKLAHVSKYSLADSDDEDEDEDEGDLLTHAGHSLGIPESKDDDNDDADGNENDEFFSKKRSSEDTEEQPPRKRTKAEVMKEVIAKSKYYKHLRQEKNAKVMSDVADLDDNFDDIMTDLSKTKSDTKVKPVVKTKQDIEYDKKVNEVQLSGRAAPSDRTKTLEELAQEKKENMEKLEQQRLRRMQGEERGPDDLDDDFWDQGDDDQDAGEVVEENEAADHEADQDTAVKTQANTIMIGGKILRLGATKSTDASLICPKTLDEFKGLLNGKKDEDVVPIIKSVFRKYQPKLAAGNKQKIGVFTGVLLEYLLSLVDEKHEHSVAYTRNIEFLASLLRDLTTKYQEEMLEYYRVHLQSAQDRLESGDSSYPKVSDLILFTMIGRIFSTSDMYHLVVIPALIVMNESLEFLDISHSMSSLFTGIYICDLILQYERVAKRISPEVISFMERAMLALVPEPEKIDKQYKSTKFTLPANKELPEDVGMIKLSSINDQSEEQRSILLLKLVVTLDKYVSNIFRDYTALLEITTPFVSILKHMIKYYALNSKVTSTLSKIMNLRKFALKERTPLLLQHHKPLAIPSYAPKFEENYNPEKKYYDPDRTRQQIGKLRHQLKEEKKQNMRALRREAEFEARQQIDESKAKYANYHAKMAKIMNTIQTEEGTAKNEYESKKRRRH